jgi:hypothetical protein
LTVVWAAVLAFVAIRATADLPFMTALVIVVAGGLALRVVFRVTGLDDWLSRFWDGSRSRKRG